MKKLILVLLFLPLFSFAQKRDSVYVQNKVFTLVYSEVLEQPKWVKYKVTCAENNVSRKGLDFYKEKTIHTSDNEDYVANDWDKGHMAPAASLNCNQDMLWETFSYLNSSLQHQSLNRGVWKKLEIRERELATKNEVKVFIRVEYPTSPMRVTTGAAIPLGYYKELKVGDRRECYYFYNKAPVSKELNDYKCNCRNVIK